MAGCVEKLAELDRESLLNLLETYYLSVVSDKYFYKLVFQHKGIQPLVPEKQVELLKVTLNHPVTQRYSPPFSFKRFFLRILLDEVEYSECEVSEELLLLYTDTLLHHTNDTNCYYNYLINKESIITIEESSSFVINSTTGLKTWEAAKYLAEWCFENLSHFESRRILELGSGTGFLGIFLLKIAHPSAFVFSDKSSEVLRLLARNVQLNIYDLKSDLTVTDESMCVPDSNLTFCNTLECKKTSTKLGISYLEWGNLTNEEANLLSPDIILAADVVYDPSVIIELVITLHRFLSTSAKFAYISFVVRNQETHAYFLQQLDSFGLVYETLQSPQNKVFVYNRTASFKLYKIFISRSILTVG